MDYRSTLNLPNQEFTIPMRAGLPTLEPELQARWDEMGLYARIQEHTKERPPYIFHDGPPYTNYPLHMGTALNRILKDFVVRYRSMAGFHVPYVPGFDNHGMPIELAVLKKFREKGETPTKPELCKACREHASFYIDLQIKQCKRLGQIADWEHRYASMDPQYEGDLLRQFGVLLEKGYIYRGLRPVVWCTTCTTALAEAEIEYDEHASDSILVAFPLREDPNGVFAGRPHAHAVIWTTTPWTIPANLAIAASPDLDYSFVEAGRRTYLISSGLVESVMNEAGLSGYSVAGTVHGSELDGLVFSHPIFDRPSPILMVDYVREEEGTGLVHTAPGHGAEDFLTGKKYGLQILCPVDANGVFTKDAGEFAGLPIAPEGNTRVIERLKEEGLLLDHRPYQHQYPHCWRCHGPLIFRATNQWFLSIDHDGLRERMLHEVGKVRWVPAHGVNRIGSMVENRPDWCLSRQRAWGIPIPAFYAPGDPEPLITTDIIDAAAKIIDKEGVEGWYTATSERVLGADFRYKGVPAAKLEKETDILDVWFDSGCSHLLVLDKRPELSWPADLYLEGSDQHRGWFNTSLVTGCAIKGSAPYRTVVTHGWVLDANYKKMSKSLGNVLEPMEMADKLGADMLRLWAANITYFEDVAASEGLIQQHADAFRRVWNTLRFLLANLSDYSPDHGGRMGELDRWTCDQWHGVLENSRKYYDAFEFHKAWDEVQLFCTNQMSSFHMDVTKDLMYCDVEDPAARRGAQAAYFYLASGICRSVAPILPHAMERVWDKLRELDPSLPGSVHLADFPTADAAGLTDEERDRWVALMKLREEINQEFEKRKAEGGFKDSFDACLSLKPPAELGPLAEPETLAMLLKFSAVQLGGEVAFSAAPGQKCERCRLWRQDVGSDSGHPTVCARCATVVRRKPA